MVVASKEGRAFEAVPQGMEKEDVDVIPVRILPGAEQATNLLKGDFWMYHPYAREGIAEIIAVQKVKGIAQMLGKAPDVMSVATSDVNAYVILQDTSFSSYSYQCHELTDGKLQALRVQTGFVTDAQKENLTKSVLQWLQTFKFDKANTSIPKKPMLESAKVLNDLKKGVTTSFNTAVEKAQKEYVIAVNGHIGTQHYLAEFGMLNKNMPGIIREILTRSMEVKEFYYTKADELLEKLKALQLKASLMKKVYSKLKELEVCLTEVPVNNEKITVDLPEQVKIIQKKWKQDACAINKAEKIEKKLKKKELPKKSEQRKNGSAKKGKGNAN